MRSWRALGLATVAAAGCATLVAGCSSAPSSSSPSTSSTSVVPSTSTTAATTTLPAALATNARQDVTTPTACSRSGSGSWVWHGTVTNTAKVTHRYTIIVDFTDAAATVEGTTTVVVRGVAPGATAEWSASGAPGRVGIRCVIRSARFS